MPYQPPQTNPSQSTLKDFYCQNLIVELNEQNEERCLGGSFTGADRLRPRLQSRDTETRTASQYGIRSIPTLML